MSNIGAVLATIIVGMVMLFVGIYMVSAVADVIPDTSIYGMNTLSNATVFNQGGTEVNESGITTTSVGTQTGAIARVVITNATCDSGSVAIRLNDVLIATTTIPADTVTTEVTGLTIRAGYNNFTLTSSAPALNASYINSTSISYHQSANYTSTGTIYSNTVTTTGTAFSVMGLVLIIVGLAIAIRSLNTMSMA